MSTTTQRQTEGHEHPDRGSLSLYHDGTPLVLDPGVGWCGYQWYALPLEQPAAVARGANGTTFDRNLQQGAWYRGSQSHSMVNFAPEGPSIAPENETWRPPGAFGAESAFLDDPFYTQTRSLCQDRLGTNIGKAENTEAFSAGHEWGLRGAAWVNSHVFSPSLDFVDLNITRAVQASQLAGVQSYHRRVFANWDDGSYLLWVRKRLSCAVSAVCPPYAILV